MCSSHVFVCCLYDRHGSSRVSVTRDFLPSHSFYCPGDCQGSNESRLLPESSPSCLLWSAVAPTGDPSRPPSSGSTLIHSQLELHGSRLMSPSLPLLPTLSASSGPSCSARQLRCKVRSAAAIETRRCCSPADRRDAASDAALARRDMLSEMLCPRRDRPLLPSRPLVSLRSSNLISDRYLG